MKEFIIFFTLIFLLFSGCNRNKVNILTYDLKRTDYIESIEAAGAIQAVNNFILLSPRINVSNMTVAHLAEEGTHVKKNETKIRPVKISFAILL